MKKSYPQYDAVLKGFLRSYEGIFDYPCVLLMNRSLRNLFLKKKKKLFLTLLKLIRLGIIEYTPQKEKPQIQFLQNRVNTADLVINQKNILKRKKAFEKRLDAIINLYKESKYVQK